MILATLLFIFAWCIGVVATWAWLINYDNFTNEFEFYIAAFFLWPLFAMAILAAALAQYEKRKAGP